MKHILIPLFFLAFFFNSFAQTQISGKPENFVKDVRAQLVASRVGNAEQIISELENVWNSGKLTAKQQEQFIAISQSLYSRKFRTSPHFLQLNTILMAALSKHNYQGNTLNNLLEVVAKTVKNENDKSLASFLNTTSTYLTTGKIHEGKFYSLYATNGNFSFSYEGESKQASADGGVDVWGSISWDDETGNDATDAWGDVTSTPAENTKLTEKQRKENSRKMFIPGQPAVTGPVLKLENTNLTFVTSHDSTTVYKTGGHLMLTQNLFVGEGGSYNWEVAGSPVSVLFGKYNFDVSNPGVKVPDATLTYNEALESPIDGAFEFRSVKRNAKGERPYPKFISFTNDARIKNLGSNVKFTGGFSLAGDVSGSTPMDGSLSQVVVMDKGVRKFRSLSNNFVVNDSLVIAQRASVVIFQDKDSLYHPSMQLRYSKPGQKLTLTHNSGVYSKTPFYDTYHKMEIVAERLQWNLTTPHVNFSVINTKTLVPVQLESTSYYSNNRYQQMIGISSFHPLQVLVAYAAKAKTHSFYAADVSAFNKINEASIRQAAHTLSGDGFLSYNGKTGYIELKQKAWHYVSSSRRINDYDHLVIKSVVPSGKNATLNLDNNKLEVRGVSRITFNSDSSNVYLIPNKGIVNILDNRNIEFNGQVYASRLAFKGTDFRFDYEKYMIDMQKLDTIALVSKKRRAVNGSTSDQVLTKKGGQQLTGKLYINKPDNKSGKEYFPDYPKFDAPYGAQVAFNRPDVLGGAYDESVYFDVPPFKIDSLSAGKAAIGFKGSFHSGGIFPPIETRMVMMPDETLGFYYQPPASGLPAFGGKGVAFDTIMMSSKGIQSKGTLKYLAATLKAPEYTYYQNAVVTKKGSTATIAEGKLGGAEFPLASLKGFTLNWLPKVDSMYLQTQKEPMQIFKEQYKLTGVAKISPGGLYANGEVDNPAASVTASNLLFKERSFSGNRAQMLVKSDVKGKAAVKALDVEFNYDLAKGNVDFALEQTGLASIEFPKAQYKTSMRSARWDFAAEKVSLKADDKGGKNYFYSLHPNQEGLRFMAGSGEYDLKKNNLNAGGVPYIAVGDSYVVPDSGKVAVAADATIRTLHNARIIADSLQQYHKLYAGNINILSRSQFTGDAIHDYQNAKLDSFKLKFSSFTYGNAQSKKKSGYTLASTKITEKDAFYIFPRILYRGNVNMHANRQHMDFDGELKLNFTGNAKDSDWFSYKEPALNSDEVRIPVIKPKKLDGVPLRTGLHMSKSSSKLYNTFVSQKQEEDDLDLFLVDGLLSYDRKQSQFKIGREERAYANSYEGNVLLYNETSNTIRFDGKLNLIKQMSDFKIESSGSGLANVDSSRYNIDAFLAFDLTMPDKALMAMSANLRDNISGAAEAVDASEDMLYKLGEFIGDKAVRQYAAQASNAYVPLPKVSNKLVRSLILNKVNLRWSNEQKAWYSVGKISMASILKDDVNAQLDGYLEIRQDINGEPTVNLYVQADAQTWYYISYFENGLTLASSNNAFNDEVSAKAKGGKGGKKYGFYTGEPLEKNQFMQHFQKTYLNGRQDFGPTAGKSEK